MSLIAHYPLIANWNDTEGNYNLTNSNVVPFTQVQWVTCAKFSGIDYQYLHVSQFPFSGDIELYVNFWMCSTTNNYSNYPSVIWLGTTQQWNENFCVRISPDYGSILCTWWWDCDAHSNYVVPTNKWINVAVAYKDWAIKMYVNGENKIDATIPSYNITWWEFSVWSQPTWGSIFTWWVSDLYVYDAIPANLETEIVDHYNATKWTYIKPKFNLHSTFGTFHKKLPTPQN